MTNINAPESIVNLNNSMEFLATKINKYISKQENSLNIDYQRSPFVSLFHNLKDPLRSDRANLVKEHKRTNPPTYVFFLNFNYTNTVLNFINNLGLNTNTNHIHIHCRINDKSNPIVFGYGDDTGDVYRQLEVEGDNEWIRMIKSFKYPVTLNYHNLLNYLEYDKFDVFIVGHSCGISDKTMLKTIFEHDKCLAIQKFHYKGQKDDFNKRMEISRHFSDKALMRVRVLPYDELATIPQQK